VRGPTVPGLRAFRLGCSAAPVAALPGRDLRSFAFAANCLMIMSDCSSKRPQVAGKSHRRTLGRARRPPVAPHGVDADAHSSLFN